MTVFALDLVIAIVVFGAFVGIFAYRDSEKERKMFQEQFQTIIEPPHTPFSISAYIDRMEKAYLDTLQERESEKTYDPVLWWGFDGLKLKADGTAEWISRRPKKEEHYVPQYPVYPIIPPLPNYSFYPSTYPAWTSYGLYPQQHGFDPCMSIQTQTAMLENQMQALNMQLAQSQINQAIISSLNNTKEVNP